MNSQLKTLLSILLLIIIIAGGVYLWKMRVPSAPQISKDNVEVTKTDLTTAVGNDRVPVGFPLGFPIETENVTESYTQDYVERGVTLYGFTYTSIKTPADVLASYKAYLEKNEATIEEEKLDPKASYLKATLVGGELLVTASAQGEGTTVQVVYTDKKQQ